MAIVINIQDAKTRLSELLRMVEAGEHVVIARAGTEIATLTPIKPKVRDLDTPLLPGMPEVDVSTLLEPMSEEELSDWEQEHANDPLFT